ncbi:MAG: hypothetical protein IPO00_08775 [Betaproteobacteria bacterium]|nr:hypothetical protein [Betaproteobacteria bacterium]
MTTAKKLAKALAGVKGLTKSDVRLVLALLMFTSLPMKIRCMKALDTLEGKP